MKKEKERISRKTVKIIVALFICSLLLATSFDLWGDKFLPSSAVSESEEESFSVKIRNSRIDKIKPSVKREENSVYTDEDIKSAVELIKDNFRKRDVYVSLVKISFDETECNELRDNRSQREKYEDKNIIVFLCDYFVLKDFAAYSKGIYTGWNMTLARENENSPWEIIDQGYA